MENYRIFVEKHPRFRVEADSLRRELNTNLNLDIRSLRLLNVYDLFGFSRELLEKSRYSVFGEVVTDSVTDSCDLAGRKYIAVEYLPGQFDQRAASAVDCVRLIDPSAQVRIRSSKMLLFDDAVSDEDLARIRHYYINAVESREKNLDVLTDMEQAEVKPVAVLEGFTKMTDAELEPCCKRYGLAMNADDLREVVKYFRAEGAIPMRPSCASSTPIGATTAAIRPSPPSWRASRSRSRSQRTRSRIRWPSTCASAANWAASTRASA